MSRTDVSQSPLSRLAGPIAVGAGGLFAVSQLAMAATLDRTDLIASMSDPLYTVSSITVFAAFCGLVIALVAVYGREARQAGTFGLIGVCAAIVGTMHMAGNYWFEVFAVPWLVEVMPDALSAPRTGLLVVGGLSSYVFFALGWVLFGVASLRARVFPVAVSVAFVLSGLVGYLAGAPPYGVPLGLSFAWLGLWIMRTTTAADSQSAGSTREPETV